MKKTRKPAKASIADLRQALDTVQPVAAPDLPPGYRVIVRIDQVAEPGNWAEASLTVPAANMASFDLAAPFVGDLLTAALQKLHTPATS